MSATITKPVRMYQSDHQPLRVIAEIQQRSPADVLHAALAEYLHNHSEELGQLFSDTQQAVASGDLDRLVALAARGTQQRVDGAVAHLADL